jgi:ribosomal protein S18 acetylase RimI-like enzyme
VTQIIRAQPADTGPLSAMLAEAFHDLPPSRWLISDEAARREVFPGYFRIYLDHALTSGAVYTTPGRDAAALWMPVGPEPPDPPDGYPERLLAATTTWTARFVAFDAALERRHPTGIPHHHLALLGVQPGRQRQGTGTALLDSYHHMLDAEAREPAYLEASSEQNRSLYLRHGYADHGPPIRLPGGPVMYPMWREPRRMLLTA